MLTRHIAKTLAGMTLSILVSFAGSSYAQSFRVMSYNVENYWDDSPDNTLNSWREFKGGLSDRERRRVGHRFIQYYDYSSNLSNWYSSEILEKKIESMLKVLSLAGYPEIVGFQEFESAGNMSRVFQTRGKGKSFKKRLEALGYRYFLLGKQNLKNPTSVTTAFISKLQIRELDSVNVSDHDPYSTSSRDIQVIEYAKGKHRFVVFNNHWKSKYGGASASEPMRIHTARLLKERIKIERTQEGTSILVLGDLNASTYEKPLLELEATGYESSMLRRRSKMLYDLWFELEEQDRWENSFNGDRGILSHMLISDDLYLDSGFQYIDRSFNVLGQKAEAKRIMLNPDGRPFRWQVRKQKGNIQHIGVGFSDHLPLIASFKYIDSGESFPQKRKIKHIANVRITKRPSVIFDEVLECDGERLTKISKVNFSKTKYWLNKCVIIEDVYPLEVSPDYYNPNFIRVRAKNGRWPLDINLKLIMNRSWDGRPNISDSRISVSEALKNRRYQKRAYGHPRSNKCFTRKILQGPGGVLTYAVGRLGYNGGVPALYIKSREESQIMLEDLPTTKQKSCIWGNRSFRD